MQGTLKSLIQIFISREVNNQQSKKTNAQQILEHLTFNTYNV